MTSPIRLAAAITLLALPAFAQQYGPTVASDLDGDGVAEQFRLTDYQDDGIVDLEITSTHGKIIARDIAWRGGIGQQPTIQLAPNGSVQVLSMNDSIGRNRWTQTLTIAYRRDAYRVAGFTYDWYDTLDLEDYGICDLNLLTGTGNLTKADKPMQLVRTSQKAVPVTEWTDDLPIPKACGLEE